jgi:hypothetical protein
MPKTQTLDAALPSAPRGGRPVVAPAELEPPVFVTTSSRRVRRLALATRAMVALIAVWFAALVLGSVGSGRLPALQPRLLSGVPSAHGVASRSRAARNKRSDRLSVAYRQRAGDRDGGPACARAKPSARRGVPCRSVAT